MFAILLSEKMDPFYQNISSFPTVFFTFFLLLTILYWLIAVLGFVEIDALDIDADVDFGEDMAGPNALAGLLHRFGLSGVPVTIIISLISLLGWLISYYSVYFIYPYIPDGLLEYVVGLPILLLSLYVGVMITSVVIRPMRSFFLEDRQVNSKSFLGQTAVVRTSRVDNNYGEATLEDGGAGLILKVRTTGDLTFQLKDRVVLLEYIENENAYRVISENDFLQK